VRLNVKQLVGALCAVCLGCSPIANAVRVNIVEPTEYSRRVDDCVEHERFRALGEAIWQEILAASPEITYSPDYELGFLDGFEAYLFKGGNALPPPLPPRYYWRPEFENVAGRVAIQDWFTGYRRGAALAKQSGYRRLVTVPASTALTRRTPAALRPRTGPPGGGQELPAPREVMPPAPPANPKPEEAPPPVPPAQPGPAAPPAPQPVPPPAPPAAGTVGPAPATSLPSPLDLGGGPTGS
jgi:hypothetical protein